MVISKYTPDLTHLSQTDYVHVYQPCADSYVLIDALECDLDLILASEPTLCVEMGCGSGIITALLAWLLSSKSHPCHFISCDINGVAIAASQATYKANKVTTADLIHCDLATPFLPRLRRTIDLLLFIPPYVPTEHNDDVLWAQLPISENKQVMVEPIEPKNHEGDAHLKKTELKHMEMMFRMAPVQKVVVPPPLKLVVEYSWKI
jgi:SAM-dependent methyltransferase